MVIAKRSSSCASVDWSASPLMLQVGADVLIRIADDVLAHLLHQAAHAALAATHESGGPELPHLPPTLSVADAAEILGVSRATAYRLLTPEGPARQQVVTADDVRRVAAGRSSTAASARTAEGRYHWAVFRDAAENLGLVVAKGRTEEGYRVTAMPAVTADRYAAALAGLQGPQMSTMSVSSRRR